MSTPYSDNPRQFPRRKGIMVIDLIANAQGKKTSVRAATLDFSSGGVRIQSPISLVTGERVEVLFASRPSHPKPCQVVWAKPAGSTLPGQAGLKFLEAVGEDELQEELG